MTGFLRMALEWRLKLVGTALLMLLVSAGLLLAQYLFAQPWLQHHRIDLLANPCAARMLFDCIAYLPAYGGWLAELVGWLEGQHAASSWLLLPSLALFVLGLGLLLVAIPKPWDALTAVRLLLTLAESDPWKTPQAVRPWVPKLYGSHWASAKDLRDLLRPPKAALGLQIYLGKWFGKPLSIYPGWGGKAELDHTLLVAPNGSGKGMLIKATLADYRGSSVVNELKGEFYAELGGYLKNKGHRVLVLSCEGKGHRFDPFLEFEGGLGLQAAARILIKGADAGKTASSDRNAIFSDRASLLLTAALVAARALGHPSLPFIAGLFSGSMRAFTLNLYGLGIPEADRWITGFLADPPDSKNWDEAQKDRFLQSCWGTFTSRVQPLLEPEILGACGSSDFRATDLRRAPTTLFLHFPGGSLEATLPLFQLVQEALIRGLTRPGEDTRANRARPILLVEDEAHALIPPNAARHVNTIRGWGLCKLTVLQAEHQLLKIAGADEVDALRAGYLTRVYYRPADYATAEDVSQRLGGLPYPLEVVSGVGGQERKSYRMDRHDKLSPQDLMHLSDEQIVIFPRGRVPVAAHRLFPQDLPTGRAAYRLEAGVLKPRAPGGPLGVLRPPHFDPRRPAGEERQPPEPPQTREPPKQPEPSESPPDPKFHPVE